MGMYVRTKGDKVLSVSPQPLKEVEGTTIQYVDWLNHTMIQYLYVDNGEVKEYEHNKINQILFKSQKIKRKRHLDRKFKNFINSEYLVIIQRSDSFDVEYYRTILLTLNTNYTGDSITKEAFNFANQYLDGETTFEDFLSNKPENEREYWKKLLKSVTRITWFERNKNKYLQLRDSIINAKTWSELWSAYSDADTFTPLPSELKLK